MPAHLSTPAILAMAQAPSGGGQQGSLISTFVPLLVIFAIFYFLMIRPQQKQQKRHREMLAALKKGDRVVTRGGIIGTIHTVADNAVVLEVAENVKIKFSRESVAGIESGSQQ
jgi:preprotein translocase subunit YajC